MSELFFYQYNILAGVLIGYCLGIIAPPLLSRRQAPFIFSFSQISISILLISIVLQYEGGKWPIALLGALICFLLQKIASHVPKEKESVVHTSLFVGLYSINQMLVSEFPQLQSYSTLHNTGDLVTLLDSETITLSFPTLFLCFIFIFFRKRMRAVNFMISTGLFLSPQNTFQKYENFFILFSYYFLLSLSNLYFGFLFTVGCLFILGLLAGFISKSDLAYHLSSLTLLATTVPFAFYFSINMNVLTVPTILLTSLAILICLLIVKAVKWVWH